MGKIWQQANASGILAAALAALLVLALPGQGDAQDGASPDERRILLIESQPRAYSILESSGRSEQSRVRLVALEAAQHAPDAAFDIARRGLADENPAVRFAALVTIGELRLERLSDAAGDMLRDPNPSVRAAAIYALSRCGEDVDLNPLARMLASDSPSTRANAALIVGRLGDPQAMGMLAEMAGLEMPRVSTAERQWVRLQFAEAMIRLDPDNEEVLVTIRAALYSPLQDLRVLAIQIIGEVGDESVIEGLAFMIEEDNPIQVRIAAAQAVARMGSQRGAQALIDASDYDTAQLRRDLQGYLRNLEGESSERQAIQEILGDPALQTRAAAEVRAQAAIAMGWLESPAAARRLAEMMDDPDPIVQVAAASSILRLSR